MSIKHTAVSYYGLGYVEHAIEDFKEMKVHGCDTVILAITEFDMDFWFPNINNIVKAAHELGLRVLADTWGIGKYFGGEPVSLFLQNNIHHRPHHINICNRVICKMFYNIKGNERRCKENKFFYACHNTFSFRSQTNLLHIIKDKRN